MCRSNNCKLIASPCRSIWAEKETQKISQRTEFGLQISSSCEGLYPERKYPACSRAESVNTRVEKETKQRVNWGCTVKSDWRQTGASGGCYSDVTLQTWGWLWDVVAGKARAPAITVTICWSVLRGWFQANWYSSTARIQQQVFEGIKHKQTVATCFITSTVWITARFPASIMCRKNQVVPSDLLRSV